MKIPSIRFLVLALFLTLSASSTVYFAARPRQFRQARHWVNKQSQTGFRSLSRLWSSAPERMRTDSRFNSDPYALHREAANTHQPRIIKERSDIAELLKKEKLVKVERGQGYRVAPMSYGRPVLTPETQAILQRLGRGFFERSGGSYFTVTSMTRTLGDQKKLSKVNVNATQNLSTHCYGVSFDVSYIRFNGKKGHNARLKRILEQELSELQREGLLYAIYEKNVHCFHISLR
jgi:hypothetical protein